MPKSPDPAEAKKHLEAMAGQELDVTPEQVRLFQFPVGAHNNADGIVLWRSILVGFKSCVQSNLVDASGSVTTGAAGSVTFLLSNVICLPPVGSRMEPVNIVATAHAATPSYVTATHTLVGGGTDLEITIFAWDTKGNPAANVTVHWRSRFAYFVIE
jgi:hypothetical protein